MNAQLKTVLLLLTLSVSLLSCTEATLDDDLKNDILATDPAKQDLDNTDDSPNG